jgi:hypothetical protein
MIRVLDDMLQKRPPEQLTTVALRKAFTQIKAETLSAEAVHKAQGSAGVRDLYTEIVKQVPL